MNKSYRFALFPLLVSSKQNVSIAVVFAAVAKSLYDEVKFFSTIQSVDSVPAKEFAEWYHKGSALLFGAQRCD